MLRPFPETVGCGCRVSRNCRRVGDCCIEQFGNGSDGVIDGFIGLRKGADGGCVGRKEFRMACGYGRLGGKRGDGFGLDDLCCPDD